MIPYVESSCWGSGYVSGLIDGKIPLNVEL